MLQLSDGSTIEASLVDVANPGVFVRASDLGFHVAPSADLAAVFNPAVVEADPALKARLEDIRRAGAERMGLDPAVESVPKIVALYPARAADAVDIRCLACKQQPASFNAYSSTDHSRCTPATLFFWRAGLRALRNLLHEHLF